MESLSFKLLKLTGLGHTRFLSMHNLIDYDCHLFYISFQETERVGPE